MRYLTNKETKDVKLRLNWNVLERLKGMALLEDKSLNYFINEILKEYIKKYKNKDVCHLFKEKPNLKYHQNNIYLYNNDFTELDLSEYKNKINLLITSPPYNLSIEYGHHDDSMEYKEYLDFTEEWLRKSYELMADDGRICVNIPLDTNKNGLKPVYADFINIAQKIGFKYQSTIVWNEQNISRRTAWGSWLSARAPYVIAPVEMIVIMYKKQWKRIKKGESAIEKNEFINWTNGVWSFSGESKKKIGHPAPFPLELPLRCIKLFSYKEDIILDPFVGSGTTLIAAMKEKRIGIGVEIDENYVNLCIDRIKGYKTTLQQSIFK